MNRKTFTKEASHLVPQVEYDCLLNKRELAKRLGVSTRSIDSWMKSGRLPYIKIGGGRRGTVRFEYSTVMETLRKHQVGG